MPIENETSWQRTFFDVVTSAITSNKVLDGSREVCDAAVTYFLKEDAIMTLRDQILQQALTLPFEDREYLAEQLGDSLQAGKFATEENWQGLVRGN